MEWIWAQIHSTPVQKDHCLGCLLGLGHIEHLAIHNNSEIVRFIILRYIFEREDLVHDIVLNRELLFDRVDLENRRDARNAIHSLATRTDE